MAGFMLATDKHAPEHRNSHSSPADRIGDRQPQRNLRKQQSNISRTLNGHDDTVFQGKAGKGTTTEQQQGSKRYGNNLPDRLGENTTPAIDLVIFQNPDIHRKSRYGQQINPYSLFPPGLNAAFPLLFIRSENIPVIISVSAKKTYIFAAADTQSPSAPKKYRRFARRSA